MREVNDKTLDLIESFEGFSATSYLCPAGWRTIGFGHVIRPGEKFDTITRAQARELMQNDLIAAKGLVDRYVEVPLTDNQYGALVSLAFNVGTAPFTGSVGKLLNEKAYERAADRILAYNKARVNGELVKVPGLVRRREAEYKLFLEK